MVKIAPLLTEILRIISTETLVPACGKGHAPLKSTWCKLQHQEAASSTEQP